MGRGVVLVTTDTLARGVNIPGVTAVVNVGLPPCTTYVHRAGRTGRLNSSRDYEYLVITLVPKAVPFAAASNWLLNLREEVQLDFVDEPTGFICTALTGGGR